MPTILDVSQLPHPKPDTVHERDNSNQANSYSNQTGRYSTISCTVGMVSFTKLVPSLTQKL